MIRVDIFCIPVTAFVLYCLVRSVRLLVIPAMTLAIAAALSYAATYFLGRYIMPVMPATPGLMSCLMISVSIDYAIFLLVRFTEELPRQQVEQSGWSCSCAREDLDDTWDEQLERAICTTMATSGATILMSGVVLLFAFLFMSVFPIDVISSMGLGAVIAMVVMISVNLTLVPALLSEFRVFFTTGLTKEDNNTKNP